MFLFGPTTCPHHNVCNYSHPQDVKAKTKIKNTSTKGARAVPHHAVQQGSASISHTQRTSLKVSCAGNFARSLYSISCPRFDYVELVVRDKAQFNPRVSILRKHSPVSSSCCSHGSGSPNKIGGLYWKDRASLAKGTLKLLWPRT